MRTSTNNWEGSCRITAAKDRETLHKISSQNAKSSGSNDFLMLSLSRLDSSGLMYRSEIADQTSSMCISCFSFDSLCVLILPYAPCFLLRLTRHIVCLACVRERCIKVVRALPINNNNQQMKIFSANNVCVYLRGVPNSLLNRL